MSFQLPEQIANALDPQYLNLILFPTENCNFRCTYCYEDFELGKMNSDVVDGIKALIKNRVPKLKHLKISWFGGEPLAAKDIIYDISTHIADLQKRYSHLIYTANMTTNGSLLNEVTFKKLSSLGVQFYQISLDGDEETHNQSRINAIGKGTFNSIWKNLLCIRNYIDMDIHVMIRIHFSPENYLKIIPLIKKINDELADDPRFSVYFKPIERLGGASDEKIQVFANESEKYDVISLLRRHLKKATMISTLSSESDYVCYASRANSLAIRSNGDIAKCTVALSDERNRIGHLNKDGTVEIDQALLRPWLKGLQSQDDLELACPYSTMKTLAQAG